MKSKYRLMLENMEKKDKKIHKGEKWFLYILRCHDGTLYTGVTKDVERRLMMHNKGSASKYTRTRGPVKVVYTENCQSRTKALVRECEVKTYSKRKKELLVGSYQLSAVHYQKKYKK